MNNLHHLQRPSIVRAILDFFYELFECQPSWNSFEQTNDERLHECLGSLSNDPDGIFGRVYHFPREIPTSTSKEFCLLQLNLGWRTSTSGFPTTSPDFMFRSDTPAAFVGRRPNIKTLIFGWEAIRGSEWVNFFRVKLSWVDSTTPSDPLSCCWQSRQNLYQIPLVGAPSRKTKRDLSRLNLKIREFLGEDFPAERLLRKVEDLRLECLI